MNYKINQISALQIFQLIRFSALMLIGVILAKSGLSTSDIGQYETFLLIAGAISFFWLNGIIQGFLPIANEESNSGKSPALFNVFYLLTAFSGLAVLFILIFERSISGFLLKGSQIPFLNYLLIYILISSPANLVEYIYLIRKQSNLILVYGIISFSLMLVLVALPPVFGYNIEYSLAGIVISAVLRFIWLLFLLFRYSNPSFDIQFILRNLKSASPLVLSLFLSGSAQYIDGFIITAFFDDATFAVFRFGAREFPLVLLLANAFSSSMLPEFNDASKLKLNLKKIKESSSKLGNWMFPLSAALMLISHEVFPVVFNANFSESATIFNIYLLLIVSRLLFPQTILIGLQKTKPIMWSSAFEIAVNVALSLWFVQIWGIAGVAYGTICAYVFEKIMLVVIVAKTCGTAVGEYIELKQHLLYSVLLTLIFAVIEFVIY